MMTSYDAPRKFQKLQHFALILIVFSLAACGHRGTKKYALEGSVLKKDPASQQVTVSHGDIAGFMPAMTMDYRIQDLTAFRELEPGDKFTADLYVNKGGMQYWLENIKITDRSKRGTVVEGQPHVLQPGEPIPDVPLVNQDGKTIHLSQFRGEALLVTFIYTRCPLPTFCPRITSQFAAIHDAFKSDPVLIGKAHLVSISFDPDYDKPDILRKYGLAYMRDPAGFSSWDFATPSTEDLKDLAFAFGLQYYPDGNQIAHSVATFLISPEGTLARIWPDNEWKTSDVLQALMDEARTAKGSAAHAGESGSSGNAAKRYVVKGVIQGVDSLKHGLVLDAEEIPGYMEAMTMFYPVADIVSLKNLKAGDHIQADLVVTGSKSYLEKITVQAVKQAKRGN